MVLCIHTRVRCTAPATTSVGGSAGECPLPPPLASFVQERAWPINMVLWLPRCLCMRVCVRGDG